MNNESKCCEKCRVFTSAVPWGMCLIKDCSCHTPAPEDWETVFWKMWGNPLVQEVSGRRIVDIFRSIIPIREAAARREGADKMDKHIAYCACGDALERTKLYPGEATYRCFGCNKIYTLVAARSEGVNG